MPEQRSEFWRNWKDLAMEIGRRSKKPFGQPSFVLYFGAIILLIGGLGVWLSVYKREWTAVPRDLSIYLLAILAAAACDLILSESNLRSLQMLALFSLVIGGILAIVGQTNSSQSRGFIYTLAGTVLALFLWWIANADNVRLGERASPVNTATGGSLDAELPGTLSGIDA